MYMLSQFQIGNIGFSMLLWGVSAVSCQNVKYLCLCPVERCLQSANRRNQCCPNSLFIENVLDFASSSSICWNKSRLNSFGWCCSSHYFIQVSRWARSLENCSTLQKFWRYRLMLWMLQSNESQLFVPPSNMFFRSTQHTLWLNNWYISPGVN